MKILYLHPKAWSGEYPILKKFRELGHDVCVLEELRGKDAGKPGLTEDFAEAGDGMPTFWYDPKRGWEKLLTWPLDRVFKRAFEGRNLVHRMWIIARAARHFRPDVVACTDGFTYAIPASFLRRLGILKQPLFASYIGGDILDCPEVGVGKRRTPMVSWLIRTSVRGVDILRPLCDSLYRILLQEGADPARIEMIPIQVGVEEAVLNSIADDRANIGQRIRKRYGIPPQAPLIVTLSGNHKGKGLHILAKAWPTVVAAGPGCRWLLCGPAEPWLEAAVWPVLRESGLEATVHFTDSLRGIDVFEHLAAGDLHVNPTLCEGLNMVTVEASGVGTPTVGTDGAGISDWMERFGAGIVVPAGQVPPLADAIISAFGDPVRLAAYGAAGRRMIADFTLGRIAGLLLGLFERAGKISATPSPD